MNRAVFFGIVLAAIVVGATAGDGVKCHVGSKDSTKEEDCPYKYCSKGVTGDVVAYSCGPEDAKEGCTEAGDVETCYCKGELCNGAGAFGSSAVGMAAAVAASFVLMRMAL